MEDYNKCKDPPSDPGDYAFNHGGNNDPTQSVPNLIIHPATPHASGSQSARHRPTPMDRGASSPTCRCDDDDDDDDMTRECPRPEKETVNADTADPSTFTAEQINNTCQFVHQTIGHQSPLASSTWHPANSPPTAVRQTLKRSKGKGHADPLLPAAQHAALSTCFAYNPLPPSEQNGHLAHAGPSMQPQHPFQPMVTENMVAVNLPPFFDRQGLAARHAMQVPPSIVPGPSVGANEGDCITLSCSQLSELLQNSAACSRDGGLESLQDEQLDLLLQGITNEGAAYATHGPPADHMSSAWPSPHIFPEKAVCILCEGFLKYILLHVVTNAALDKATCKAPVPESTLELAGTSLHLLNSQGFDPAPEALLDALEWFEACMNLVTAISLFMLATEGEPPGGPTAQLIACQFHTHFMYLCNHRADGLQHLSALRTG
ncbi:hypothetical protein DXG01_002556 [Tephrocybe rancida]|nr:hypothetical protein DXG01_002556 [Tephrocybe rancida]